MDVKEEIPSKLHLERSIFEQFMEYTRRYSKTEWGGLLIGLKIDGELYAVAAVIPPQKSKSTVYCEFKRELFTVLYNCFENIEEKYGDNNLKITTWIHSHPGFGVFLSSTDLETYEYLVKLNPQYSAVVVDPVRRDLLAVNSKPGNLNGFSQLDINLNYFHNFENPDQSLLDMLQIIKSSINKGINRKLFKLDENEEITVFIPITLNSLKHKIIKSRLKGLEKEINNTALFLLKKNLKATLLNVFIPGLKELLKQTKKVRENFLQGESMSPVQLGELLPELEGLVKQIQGLGEIFFQEQPREEFQSRDYDDEGILNIEEDINTEVQDLEQYFGYFQKIEEEMESWLETFRDRILYQFHISQIPRNVIFYVLKAIKKLGYIFWATAVEHFMLTRKHFGYKDRWDTHLIKWTDIREIELEELEEVENFCLLTLKKGRIFGKDRLLLFFPQQSFTEIQEILTGKTKVILNRQSKKLNNKLHRYEKYLKYTSIQSREKKKGSLKSTRDSKKLGPIEGEDKNELSEEVKEQEDSESKSNQEKVDYIS